MASSKEFADYVCAQIDPSFCPIARKMFGEYTVYLCGKPALLICDNCVFVKKLPQLAGLTDELSCGYPYEGAKEHYMLDVEDTERLEKLLPALVAALPDKAKKH